MPTVYLNNAQQPGFSVNFARAHSLAAHSWRLAAAGKPGSGEQFHAE
jgi:hypothetical protein